MGESSTKGLPEGHPKGQKVAFPLWEVGYRWTEQGSLSICSQVLPPQSPSTVLPSEPERIGNTHISTCLPAQTIASRQYSDKGSKKAYRTRSHHSFPHAAGSQLLSTFQTEAESCVLGQATHLQGRAGAGVKAITDKHSKGVAHAAQQLHRLCMCEAQ